MRKTLFLLLFALLAVSSVFGQTTINFDTPASWITGSAAITSYATDHVYSEGLFSATGGPALRNGVSAQDGFAGALGMYAWRLTNAPAEWIITIASGGVANFSIDLRRWDGSPSPAYNLDYSTDGGTIWTNVAAINNTTLDNSSAWKTFNGTINNANTNIKIRLIATGATERIMVDNFVWTGYAGVTPVINAPASLPAFSTIAGTPSAIQSYTLSCSNLTDQISVTAPTGYEISTDQSEWVDVILRSANFTGLIYVRLAGTTAGTFNGNIVHSSAGATPVNTAVTGTVSDTTPTITAPASLPAFSATTGTPSAIQSYTLSCSNLTAQISVAAPTGYEISTDQSEWVDVLLRPADFNDLVYVRMTGTTAGTFEGNIVHTSGTTTVNTAVTGIVSDPNPEILTIGTLYPFQTMTGQPSPAQSYLITGADLSMDITVTAPAGFNVSSNGTLYSQSISVPSNSTDAQVYVRLTGASAGTFSGNVSNVSAPAPQVNLAVTGVVSNLLFEENFVYPETDPLTNHGWAVQGIATPVVTVSAPSLTYPNYPSTGGNSVLLGNTGQDVNHTFSEQSTGSVYASALVNVSASQSEGDYFLHLGPSVIGTTFRARVFVKYQSATEFKFGISFAGNETVAAYTTVNYSIGTTYLVVLKYAVVDGTGNDTAFLYVNPAFNSGEPAYTLQAPDTNSDLAGIGTVALRQGNSAKAATVRVDGIRVANSWENLWGMQFNSEISLLDGPLEEFSSVVGTPSGNQQYSVRGTDLSTGITVTAPAGFQLSLDGDTEWQSSLIIPAVDGSVDSPLYVRFFPADLLTYDGVINHTSGSATPQTMAVRGVATPPLGVITVNETPLTFDAISGSPSNAQQISVQGSNLIAPIVASVEAPFQIKKTTETIWGLSAELAANFNGSIDVRFNPTVGGNFNGQVMFTSTDSTTKYTPLTGTAVQAVTTIAQLRSQIPGTSTKFALTGQGVITYIRSVTRDQFYLQDATAAIVVDDINHLVSNTLLIGDGITNLTGTLALYNSLLQFTPTSEITAATSTGNPVVAETRTLASLTSADQAKLVLINNLSFTSTGTFAASQSYPVSDASGNGIMRTNFALTDGADYIGTAIPVVAQHLTALVGQFNADIQITPRTLADFEAAAVVPVPTKLVVTAINPVSPTVGQPFSVTVQAQDNAGTPIAVTSDTVINLSRATGTGTLSGTLSGTMNNLQNTLTITGVLYDTAQTGVSITATAFSGMALTAGTSSLFEVLAAGVEPVVVHYWNFNTNPPATGVNWTQPIPAYMGTGGSLSYDFTTAVSFGGTTLNGTSAEVAGGSFCPTGGVAAVENNGHYYELSVPTSGYESIVFSYASRGTTNGFSSQEIQYSTDGTNFQTMQTFTGMNVATFIVKSVDFSGITGANNNPNFKIRVIVSGATATSGNNRFDNIKLMGLAQTGGTLASPEVTITRDGNNVVLNWNAIPGANSGYRIEVDTNPYGSFSTIYNTLPGVLTWSETTAEKKFYRVVARP